MIDKLTKYAHFLCLSHPYTAITVAQTFLAHVYKLHGMPSVIISDRDKIFTSAFWQELFKLTDTTLNMSPTYHPQTDGQIERLNQCLKTYLRCMVQSCPNKWAQWIPLAEFWYDSIFHSALVLTPFQALCGHKPRHFGITVDDTCSVSDLDQWLKERQVMLDHIQHNLQRAQDHMKHQADKHRQERTFHVGTGYMSSSSPMCSSRFIDILTINWVSNILVLIWSCKRSVRLHINSSCLPPVKYIGLYMFPSWRRPFLHRFHYLMTRNLIC